MIKALGPLRDWEYTFDPFWSEVPYAEQETERDRQRSDPGGFVWFSPHQNAGRQRLMPPTDKEEYSAAMWIETNNGPFLLGRNFTREAPEIFKLEKKGLFPLSAMDLMDLTSFYRSSRSLNPLDFRSLVLFQNTTFCR